MHTKSELKDVALPLTEVVYGVYFERISGFSSIHPGLVWSKFKDKYPEFEDRAPLISDTQNFQEFINLPPLRRTWIISEDKSKLIQLQDNAFFCNWKRSELSTSYPKHETLLNEFENNFLKFSNLVEGEDTLGGLNKIVGLELTYINHLIEGQHWNDLDYIGEIIPGIKSVLQAKDNISSIQITTFHDFPHHNGKLRLKLQEASRDNKKIYILEFSATYAGEDINKEDLNNWFIEAHQQIINLFEKTIPEKVRKTWGVKNG